MVRLRPLDASGIRSYLDELRPRLLLLRVRARKVHVRWAIPNWAIEELMRFALRGAPLVARLAPHLPGPTAQRVRRFGAADDRRRILALLDEFFSEEHRDLLALPRGEPLVSVEAHDVHLEIRQVVLGARA